MELALEIALRHYLDPAANDPPSPQMPKATEDDGFGSFVLQHNLDDDAQRLLLLALAPRLRPDFLDGVIHRVLPQAGDYPILGGIRGRQHRGVLPTGDTALFLLAGTDIEGRAFWQGQLCGDHPLIRSGVVALHPPVDGEPPMSGRLTLDSETAERWITGQVRPPRMGHAFPARRLETAMTWEDLVLPAKTLGRIDELDDWVRHRRTLMEGWGMGRALRPGCRALFYGPPGTGKTLTATLLGKRTGREVYRIDLASIVSKYIGETEKNLSRLFDKAENKDWILFFDEADSLFGKRTQVRDARDRYANQEVSFLLQRVETFEGLVILASNLTQNVDEAFARRFEQIVHFPTPRQGERRLLWRKGLPAGVPLDPAVDLDHLAARYELSGGMIMNAVRHACLRSIADGRDEIRLTDLEEGIRREYAKENRLQ
ncbi:MAG: ATP-binding protein [Acidobacteriota bacterium]